MIKTRFQTYNDGVLYACRPPEEKSSFNAVKNQSEKKDIKKRLKLDYKEMTKRDQDMAFAESFGRTLNMKVKTPLNDDVKSTDEILIGDTLYSLIHIDFNRGGKEMYLYMEEARKVK